MIRAGFYFQILLIVSLLWSCSNSKETDHVVPSDITNEATASRQHLVNGVPVDSLKMIQGRIRANKFLSDILLQYGISYPEVNQVIENSKDVFDVRKMVSGSDYQIYCDTVPTLKARYFVYSHNPVTTYVFSFKDSLNITMFTKEVSKEIKYASGTIQSSLWESMTSNDLNPMIAIELSEIFAWTVDFFGLQRGDWFKVIYEEQYIEDKSIGIGRIYGAQYTWSGKTFTAIPFIQDSVASYFDVDGSSLRKAFLKAPLRYSRISSRFSAGRMHPVLRVVRPHHGVDYAAPLGTPVVSIGDGRVTSTSYDNANGRIVRIQHNSVYSTAYLHLSRFGEGIKAGKIVKQGDIIGYVGSSGLSTGPHLDFRFYVNGTAVDPLKVESPSVDPIHEENQERFNIAKTVTLTMLETISFNDTISSQVQ